MWPSTSIFLNKPVSFPGNQLFNQTLPQNEGHEVFKNDKTSFHLTFCCHAEFIDLFFENNLSYTRQSSQKIDQTHLFGELFFIPSVNQQKQLRVNSGFENNFGHMYECFNWFKIYLNYWDCHRYIKPRNCIIIETTNGSVKFHWITAFFTEMQKNHENLGKFTVSSTEALKILCSDCFFFWPEAFCQKSSSHTDELLGKNIRK